MNEWHIEIFSLHTLVQLA